MVKLAFSQNTQTSFENSNAIDLAFIHISHSEMCDKFIVVALWRCDFYAISKFLNFTKFRRWWLLTTMKCKLTSLNAASNLFNLFAECLWNKQSDILANQMFCEQCLLSYDKPHFDHINWLLIFLSRINFEYFEGLILSLFSCCSL